MTRTNESIDLLEERVHQMDAEVRGKKALSNSRIKLILGKEASSVFFATLALRLEPQVAWHVQTLATDGKTLVYNPDFLLSLTESERIGVMAHEVLHCALAHPSRRQHRDLERYNLAADLAVNPLIREAGFTLPQGAIYPGEGDYKHFPLGKSMEEYYALLQPPPQEGDPGEQGQQPSPGPGPGAGQGQGDGEGEGQGDSPGKGQGKPAPDPGGCGGVQDAGDGSPAAQRESKAEWEVAVAQAHSQAKQRGNLPGGLARLVQEMLTPKVDWKEVLREFVTRLAKNDFAWFPPNKRFIYQGLYLPGMRSEELDEVCLAVDTSGSIGAKELQRFASEIQGILESFDVELTILYHDAQVAHVQTWQSSDGPLVMEPRGGGGTSHVPVFEYIEEHGLNPACLVCLTDLYSSFPKDPPAYPVLWASTSQGMEGPFGTTVEVTL